MLFFLCFRPTIKFQGGSPVDPLLEPPADPPPLLTRPLKNYFYRHFGVSDLSYTGSARATETPWSVGAVQTTILGKTLPDLRRYQGLVRFSWGPRLSGLKQKENKGKISKDGALRKGPPFHGSWS